MKVGIAIDTWKLEIFHRLLSESGYVYEQMPLGESVLLLTVRTENVEALSEMIVLANTEAALTEGGKDASTR